MPVKYATAKLWYYEDFLPAVQNDDLLPDRPEDWARLQIWDGTALRPALPEGFSGTPTDAQLEELFAHVKNDTLFLFKLGDPVPKRVCYGHILDLPLDPKEPAPPAPLAMEKPVKPTVPNPSNMPNPESLTNEEREEYKKQWNAYTDQSGQYSSLEVSYKFALNNYNHYLKRYEEDKARVEALGEGFKNGVNGFNAGRDLEQETKAQQARVNNKSFVKEKRNLDKAEGVISQLMAPRPVVMPEIFFEDGRDIPKEYRSSTSDATFSYKVYNEHMEGSGYDLPENDKLDAYDAATINFAMMGAYGYVGEYVLNHMEEGGPAGSRIEALRGFNFMVTGTFGKNRKGQPSAEFLGVGLRLGKEAIEKYLDGDAAPLGKHLADCVQSIKLTFAGSTQNLLTPDTVSAARLTERILKLFDKNPDIQQATGLQEKDLQFMRGYVQMGNILDNYLNGRIRLNNAELPGQALTAEERAGILADIVLRRMVEQELEKDVDTVESSDAYQQAVVEAGRKDAALEREFEKWKKKQGVDPEDPAADITAREEYKKKHDLNVHGPAMIIFPAEHRIISVLGQPGALERMRQNLLKDPALLERAQQPQFGCVSRAVKEANPLEKGADLDGLVGQLRPMLENSMYSENQKYNWFVSMKSMLSRGKVDQGPDAVSPWLNPKAAGDAGRLLIAQDDGQGGKTLVNVASLLQNGLADLQDPSPETIALLHRHATAGDLYYYDVGKDMPLRLNADAEKASFENLTVPKQPTTWQKVANFLTGGRAYADIFNAKPDRDPAALQAFLNAREARAAVAATEDAARREAIRRPAAAAAQDKPVRDNEAVALERSAMRNAMGEQYDRIHRFEIPANDGAVRTYPSYDTDAVCDKLTAILDKEPSASSGKEMVTVTAKLLEAFENGTAVEQEDMCEFMALAVLSAGVRQERATTETGLGPIEQKMITEPKEMIRSMMNDSTFRAFTENVSESMFKHFVMTDGAMNMYKTIQSAAARQENLRAQSDVQKQAEKNLEKKPEEMGIGMN